MSLSIRRIDDLDAVRSEWTSLVDSNPRSTIFQTWEWVNGVVRHRTAGGEPHILGAFEGAHLAGVVPLVIAKGKLGLIGGDYADIISCPSREAEILGKFATEISDLKLQWSLLDFRNLAQESCAIFGGTPYEQLPHQAYAAIQLPSSWEAYEQSLGKNLRSQLRYYQRRQAKLGTVEIHLATPESVLSDMESFFRLHALRWKSKGQDGVLGQESVQAFHRNIAAAFVQSDKLRLWTLRINGDSVASLYCFRHHQTTSYYLAGFNPEFSDLRPSKTLMAHAIKSSIEEADEWFDFLKGDEDYKAKWSTVERPTYRLMSAKPKIIPQVILAAQKIKARRSSL